MSKSKLQFTIEKSPFKKTIDAKIVVRKNGSNSYIDINENSPLLFKYATEYAIKNGLSIEKEIKKEGLNKTTTVSFGKPNKILSSFGDKTNKIFNAFKLKRAAISGAIISFAGILSTSAFILMNSNNVKINQCEEEYAIADDIDINNYNLRAGVSRTLTENLKHTTVSLEDSDIYLTSTSDEEVVEEIIEEETYDDLVEFYYDDQSSNENAINASQYYDYYEEYGNKYGLPPILLQAKAAQESGGNPNASSGLAGGLMQAAYSHNGSTRYAENIQSHETDSIYVDSSLYSDARYSVELGTMIAQSAFIRYNYDIFKALQAYNMGEGSMDYLESAYGADWLNHRGEINGGDATYAEKVLSYIPSGTILEFTKPDGSIYKVKVVNRTVEKEVMSEEEKQQKIEEFNQLLENENTEIEGVELFNDYVDSLNTENDIESPKVLVKE